MRRLLALCLVATTVVIALGGCGSSATRSSSVAVSSTVTANTSGSQLARVLVACEQNGAAALLPGSNGQDTSAVPDNTPTICGCWTSWMQQSLSPSDQATIAASVGQPGSPATQIAIATDLPLLQKLAFSLQSCDLGQTPSATSETDTAATQPPPTANGTSLPTATVPSAGTGSATSTFATAPQSPPSTGPATNQECGQASTYAGSPAARVATQNVQCDVALHIAATFYEGKAQISPNSVGQYVIQGYDCAASVHDMVLQCESGSSAIYAAPAAWWSKPIWLPTTTCGTFTLPQVYGAGVATVGMSPGVPCPTAMSVMRTLYEGGGQHHIGSSLSTSYTVIDGWRCEGPEDGSASCSRGAVTLNATNT